MMKSDEKIMKIMKVFFFLASEIISNNNKIIHNENK
jgi:hypothetical protein